MEGPKSQFQQACGMHHPLRLKIDDLFQEPYGELSSRYPLGNGKAQIQMQAIKAILPAITNRWKISW